MICQRSMLATHLRQESQVGFLRLEFPRRILKFIRLPKPMSGTLSCMSKKTRNQRAIRRHTELSSATVVKGSAKASMVVPLLSQELANPSRSLRCRQKHRAR
jgi:hypothetical protein